MLCSFFARTHLAVAVVPEGRIRKASDACGACADLLSAIHLRLSPAAMLCGKSITDEETRILLQWLSRIQAPLFFDPRDSGNFDTTVAAIAYRTTHLALLCGCRFTYDFTGFGYAPLKIENFDLLMGAAFAVFLATHRVAEGRTVAMEGDQPMGEGPVIHAMFKRTGPPSPLPELEHLCRLAQWRGELFDVTPYPDAPECLHIRFSLKPKEISVQGIKNPLPFPTEKYALSLPYTQRESAEDAGNISDP